MRTRAFYPDFLRRRLAPRPDWQDGADAAVEAAMRDPEDARNAWEAPDVVAMAVCIEPSEEAELVRDVAERTLRERIDLLGIERSGAYEHYQMQLDIGLPVPIYELAIVDLVRSRVPDLRSYHEIGSGLGMLPFMLALAGFASVGIERDQRRHLTATAILRELAVQVPQVESQCRLIGGPFPEAVIDIDVSESMAIVTDLVCTHTRQEFLNVCRGLARYRYVLLDVQRFCLKRETEEEYRELLGELVRFGLMPYPEIIDMGSQGRYYLLESKPLRQSRNQAGATAPALKAVPQHGAAAEALVRRVQDAQVPAAAPAARLPATVLPPSPQRAVRKRFGGGIGLSALLMIGIPSLLGILYYTAIAANQYVTNFEFAVRSPVKQTGASSSYTGGLMMSPDAFVITDFINGQQAVDDVGKDIDLRAIFSRPHGDFWSRLDRGVSMEGLTAYWQDMVNAHFDLVSGNVSVTVRAFTPLDSLNLANVLIAKSDDAFRRLNSQAQHDAVRLADENVVRAEKRLSESRQELQEFREKNGILDAGKVAVSSTALTDNLRKELASLLTEYETLKESSPHSPALPVFRSRITALQNQIKGSAQTSQSGAPITRVTAEVMGRFETLDLNRQFAEKQYTEALGLREKAYLAAQDQQSYLALFVKPALAQNSLYPDRPRAIVTIILAAAAAWFVGVLVVFAIRDHLM